MVSKPNAQNISGLIRKLASVALILTRTASMPRNIKPAWSDRTVLTLLVEHGLKAKCAKYIWAYQKVGFCGFDIDKDSIHAQEHKTCMVRSDSIDLTGGTWSQSQMRKIYLGLSESWLLWL